MKGARAPIDRRDFLRTVGVATGAAALTKTVPADLVAAPTANGMALAETPKGGTAKEPPLFEKERPDWEIKFADASNSVLSVMSGESNKTFYDPLIKREVKWEQDVYCPACSVFNDKLYCVYLAPDEESVREHASRGGFPANRISAVRHLMDPINYR